MLSYQYTLSIEQEHISQTLLIEKAQVCMIIGN